MQKTLAQNLVVVALALLVSIFIASPVKSQEITAKDLVYLTEEYPPWSFTRDGKLSGACVEILMLMWQRLGLSNKIEDIKVVPWARGMKLIREEPNVVLFGMGYSQERAEMLHWIGAYHVHSLVLIAKKSRALKINSVKEAQRFTVGAVREDIGHQLLVSKGFDGNLLALSNNQSSLLLKLKAGRVDMISYMDDVAFKNMRRSGLNPNEYEIVLDIQTLRSGFGFSRKIPDKVILQFQRALNLILANGSVNKILKKYDIK